MSGRSSASPVLNSEELARVTAQPRIAFVVAVARNGVIGRDGRFAVAHFIRSQALQGDHHGQAGRSWGARPGRACRASRCRDATTSSSPASRIMRAEGAIVAAQSRSMRSRRGRNGADEVCVIGGGEIFREVMPIARPALSERGRSRRPRAIRSFPHIDADDMEGSLARNSSARGPNDDAGFALRVLDRTVSAPHS